MISLNPQTVAVQMPMVSLDHLNSQGKEKMRETHQYSVCVFLGEALKHRECETYVELIDTLYDEGWPPDVMDRISTFLSKNFSCVHREGKIDSLAVAEVLRATQPGLLRGYDGQCDRDRWPSDVERVQRNVLILHELYRQKELPTSLDEYLESKVQLPADYEVLRKCIAPALGKNRTIDRGNLLLSSKRFYGVQIVPLVEPQRLMDVTRETLGFLLRTHGKSPLEKVQVELEYVHSRLRRLRGEVKKKTGDALQVVQAQLAKAEETEKEIFERRARLLTEAESQLAATLSVVESTTAVQVMTAMKMARAAELVALAASVHRAAGLVLTGLAAKTNLPADVIVGWQLKKVVLALTSDDQPPSFVTELINSLVGHGLTVLTRKASPLQTLFRWTEVDYGPVDQVETLKLTFVQRVATKLVNEEMSSLSGLRATHNWIASNTSGIIFDTEFDWQSKRGAVDWLSPVVVETQVETAAEAVMAAASVAVEEVPVEPVPVAGSVAVKTIVPEEESMREVVTELPVYDGSPLMAAFSKLAGWVLEKLEAQGWPRGLLTFGILKAVMKVVHPTVDNVGPSINNFNGKLWDRVYSDRINEAIWQQRQLKVNGSVPSWLAPVEPTLDDAQRLVDWILSEEQQPQQIIEYIMAHVPGAVMSTSSVALVPLPPGQTTRIEIEPEAELEHETEVTAQPAVTEAVSEVVLMTVPVEAVEPTLEPVPETVSETVLDVEEQRRQLLLGWMAEDQAKIEDAQRAQTSCEQAVAELQEQLRLAMELLEQQKKSTQAVVLASAQRLEHLQALLKM